MAWQDESLPILRTLIGDDLAPYTYSDTRLIDIMVSSAKMINFELSFDTEYTITVSTSTISPDPSTDNYFIPLMVLYAASKIAGGEYRQASLESVSVTDGPATIDLGSRATSLKSRMEALQKDYNSAKLQYMVGNAIGCQSVLSTARSIYANCYRDGYYDNRYYSGLNPFTYD